jgi:hypothetical protein
MKAKGVEYIAIKRDNMIKTKEESLYYKLLSRANKEDYR